MTTTSTRGSYQSSTRPTGASTVASFAGVMLVTLGIFQILQGLTAVVRDDLYVTTPNYIFSFDVSSWGWIHMALGAAAIIIGIGLFAGQQWANIAGIAFAALSAINNFLFLPYYPLWSMVVIAFDVFVIWALCVQVGDAGEY